MPQRGICCRRVSVCLSQAGVLSKQLDESSWVLAQRFPLTYPTLCYREIRVSPKIRVLTSGTLQQTLYLENVATASRSCCRQNSSLSSSTVELVDDHYITIDESWLFTRAVWCIVGRAADVLAYLYHIISRCRTRMSMGGDAVRLGR